MTIQVKFTMEVPEKATNEEIQKWLEFELGANGNLSCDNPLISSGLEADSFSVEFDDY